MKQVFGDNDSPTNSVAVIRDLPLESCNLGVWLDDDMLSMKEEGFLENDLKEIKTWMLDHSGPLHAIFYYLNSHEDVADMGIER